LTYATNKNRILKVPL